MDQKIVATWQGTSDQADTAPIGSDLPKEAPLGFVLEDMYGGKFRKWIRVEIITGSPGSRWAYWKSWMDPVTCLQGQGRHPEYQVVADKIFNGDAAHFAGMLAIPYTGPYGERLGWVLLDPDAPPTPITVYEERPDVRYERSKEVFDVSTRETKTL